MRTSIFMIFDQWGFVAAKKTSGFKLNAGERAVQLNISIPDKAFEPASFMQFNAEVPVEMVLRPAVDISAEPVMPEGNMQDA